MGDGAGSGTRRNGRARRPVALFKLVEGYEEEDGEEENLREEQEKEEDED